MNATKDNRPFAVGDVAILQPLRGAGRIVGLQERDAGTGTGLQRYLVFEGFGEHGQRAFVPEATSAEALRRPVSRAGAEALLASLRAEGVTADRRAWTKRYTDYDRTLKVGSAPELAACLRRLYALKKLSFGERKMILVFEGLVLGEIAQVLDVPYADLEQEMRRRYPAIAQPS